MEFSGRSVDEAIFNGLKAMGVTIDEVEIETIKNETKGIFGIGAKDAVVRLTEREVPLSVEYEKSIRTESERREPRPERKETVQRREGRNRQENRRGRREERASEPQYDYSEETAAGIPAAQFLSELLQKMNISGKVLAAQTEEGIRLNIEAGSDGLVIGRRGETLDALQSLVSLYANREKMGDDYVRITLDAEGYRASREETLRRLARRSAVQVRTTGRSVSMEPMNPYERRVLHAALSDFDGVETHSEGEEPNRHVVISPTSER